MVIFGFLLMPYRKIRTLRRDCIMASWRCFSLMEALESSPIFWPKGCSIRDVFGMEKEIVVELAEDIKQGFDNLIKALDPQKYPKARTYIENFASNALLVFDYWLEGKGWIPLTTNAIESAFIRIVNRVKHVGRRWSDEGLLNWLMIAFRKIYKPALWGELWRKYLEIHKPLRFFKLRVSYLGQSQDLSLK